MPFHIQSNAIGAPLQAWHCRLSLVFFMYFLDAFDPFMLPLWVLGLSGAACGVAWRLCGKPRFLAWQAAALGLLAMALAWHAASEGRLANTLLVSCLCVLAAAAMSQATASRLGQQRAMGRWLVVGALVVVAISLAIGMPSSGASVLAWACACVVGQHLRALWRTPLRHRWEHWMLYAHTATLVWLLLYPLAVWMGAADSVSTAWWSLCMLTALLLYSAALLACAWTEHRYRGPGARMDDLTGVMPRLALEAACDPLPYVRGLRVLILCDIDQFRRISAEHGRAQGDEALRGFARILQASVREGDHVGRLGDEEFAIALRQIDLPSAHALVMRINTQLSRAPWAQAMPGGPVTASFGIAAILEEDRFDTALHRADVLLYQAKEAGPNRIWMDSVAPPALHAIK